MTVIAIRHLTPISGANVILDKLLAIDALLFLVSGIFSFSSIRNSRLATRLERYAEQIFLLAQALLALGAIGLAFVIT